MNQSVINICNTALSYIGGSRITSLDSLKEPREEARLCKRFYPIARDTLLRDYPYGFAVQETALALLEHRVNDRVYPFKYRYPSACLKIWVVAPEGMLYSEHIPSFVKWRLSGAKSVLCNLDKAWARYSWQVEDPNQFDPLFTEALALSLAARLALAFNNAPRARELNESALAAASKAQCADANEERHILPEDYFITARY